LRYYRYQVVTASNFEIKVWRVFFENTLEVDNDNDNGTYAGNKNTSLKAGGGDSSKNFANQYYNFDLQFVLLRELEFED